MVHAAYPELRQAPRAPRMVPALPPRPGKPAGKADFDMEITGLVPGMAYHFAGCCHAVPGDAIVGIIATGKGVTIHARDCPTLEAFAATPERFIDVDWNHDALPRNGAGHTARVSVIAANEPSAVADVANAVSKYEGSVAALQIGEPPAGFHGDPGGCRRARPGAPGESHRRPARAVHRQGRRACKGVGSGDQ